MRQLTHTGVALAPLLFGLLVLLSASAQAQLSLPSTAGITKEVMRTASQNDRLINFWWLPQEFWLAAARERHMSQSETEEVRRVFRDYLFVAVLEARAEDGKPVFGTIAEIVKRGRFVRNGEQLEVLRQVSPRLAELAPKLIHALRASLAMLGEGLVLLPMPNVDSSGNPILHGTSHGDLRVEFRTGPATERLEFRWRGPLTAVIGSQICPEGGEPLEASWTHCPWHGVKIVSPRPADAKN